MKPLQDEHPASTAALEVLEEIDDDLDEQGIVFVKLDDEVFYLNYTRNSSIGDKDDRMQCQRNLPQKEAAEYGIEEFPKLVVFENGIPNLYDGGFTDGQVTIII